jgi:hypothetical protein
MSDASTPNARRCTICALSFPPEEAWKTCAQCGEATDPIGNAAPNITTEEATSMLRHREFEEYLEKEGKK